MDVTSADSMPGDRFLICTDGLYGMVADEGIADMLRAERIDDAADALLAAAMDAGGTDNITLLVLEHAGEVEA